MIQLSNCEDLSEIRPKDYKSSQKMPTLVYLGNLNSCTEANDVENSFAKFGTIKEIVLCAKFGFALISYSKNEDALLCSNQMNGGIFLGNKLKVEIASFSRIPLPVPDEKKVFLKIVSSSHGLNNERRHLQRELRRVMKVNNTFFTEANFDAVGGHKIDEDLVEKIINDMKKVNFVNMTLVLIIGSSNIRKKGKAIDIMEYFEMLLKFVNFWRNFRVVVCGIIPSIPDARSKKNFCEASKLLKKMCLKYDVALFCPLAGYSTN